VERSDCLIVGSRGGQVVLPYLWKNAGATTPPAVVINGGCAMKLPEAPCWPDEAATFLLIGGHDYFRGQCSRDEYVDDVKARVPARNSTTAVLFVGEMGHQPHSALLRAVLRPAIAGLLTWQESCEAPLDDFRLILASLNSRGFSGVLAYTKTDGGWQDLPFGAKEPVSAVAPSETAPFEESASRAVKAACVLPVARGSSARPGTASHHLSFACVVPSVYAAQEAAGCPSPPSTTAPGSDTLGEDEQEASSCSSVASPRSDTQKEASSPQEREATRRTRPPGCGASGEDEDEASSCSSVASPRSDTQEEASSPQERESTRRTRPPGCGATGGSFERFFTFFPQCEARHSAAVEVITN